MHYCSLLILEPSEIEGFKMVFGKYGDAKQKVIRHNLERLKKNLKYLDPNAEINLFRKSGLSWVEFSLQISIYRRQNAGPISMEPIDPCEYPRNEWGEPND